jgi:EAL domain-containing protein (putative c-di-GMP-specific phosphodiesterase class I)/GGDEF domain-containing protein
MITLNRQLYAIVALVVLAMFLCGVIISTASNIKQINEQLLVKNNDSANLLAQMLTEVEKDPVLLELLISAQFDSGHYELIELRGVDDSFSIRREFSGRTHLRAPEWFASLVHIDAAAGVGLISDGWSQFGSIKVKSHSQYLVDEIWISTKLFAYWSAAIAIVLGLGSAFLQSIITRPLSAVISQAEALGNKRFVSLPLPKTVEYRRLVIAMNRLTERVQVMLKKEAAKLAALRFKTEHDEVTGVFNREVFINNLTVLLSDSDKAAEHGVAIIRIKDLERLNKERGRKSVDEFLKRLASALLIFSKSDTLQHQDSMVARLNGSDFAVLSIHPTEFSSASKQIYETIHKVCIDAEIPTNQIVVASTNFSPLDTKAQVLMRIDSVLIDIDASKSNITHLHSDKSRVTPFLTAHDWRTALSDAIKADKVFFQFYPVMALADKSIIHHECHIRAELDGEVRSAAFFLPWARRLGLIDQAECAAVRTILHSSTPQQPKLSFKLSFDFLSKEHNRKLLRDLMTVKVGGQFSVEIHEAAFIEHTDTLSLYCIELQQAGFSIGLQSALNCFDKLTNIQQFGLDFIKLHESIIQSAHETSHGQNILKGFCVLGHSLGAQVITQGFQMHHDQALLEELGVDGVTGLGLIQT